MQFPTFIPDVAGLYELSYLSTSGANTYTSPTRKSPGSISINAAEWTGVGVIGGTTATSPQCGTCHDGSPEGDKVTKWSATKHANIFENSMSTYAGLAPEPYLWEFHSVGYNLSASNKGFDDQAALVGFTFPEAGLSFASFTSSYPEVAKLATVQCENCHGPGSQHAGDPLRIAYSSTQAGVCGQCHIQEAEWVNSGHNFVGVEHGSGNYQNSWSGSSAGCLRCHNASGFGTYLEEGEEGLSTALLTNPTADFPGVTCAGCHNPHDATNPAQLRLYGNVTMAIDGSTVNAGKAAVCYTCHDGNYALHETDCDVNGDGSVTSADDDNTTGVATVDGVCSTKYGTAIGRKTGDRGSQQRWDQRPDLGRKLLPLGLVVHPFGGYWK